MIVPMKKYSFLIYHKEYKDFLIKLRDLGVVHLQERQPAKELEEIQQFLAEKKSVENLLQRMNKMRTTVAENNTPTSNIGELPTQVFEDPDLYIRTVEEIDQEIDCLTSKRLELNREHAELEQWGDFDPAILETLKENGYPIHFWSIPNANYNPEWEKDYEILVVSNNQRFTNFITIGNNSSNKVEAATEASPILPPMKSILRVKQEIEEVTSQITRLQNKLLYLSTNTSSLQTRIKELQEKYNWKNAWVQGNRLFDEKLVILQGWIPADLSKQLEASLNSEGTAYTEEPIYEGDNVPIQLKNNFFTKAFEPIVKMFSLPNYFEIDPTPFVAPFFMLFFAMCFGDAGYGLLVLLACTITKIRTSKEGIKPLLTLFQWLGGAAVIVGFFSGSFFGIELAKVEALAKVRHYFISSNNMMVISLAIGILQILLAKLVAAFKVKKQKGIKHALSNFAWTIFIIAMLALFLLGMPQLNITLPMVVHYIIYGIVAICLLVMLFYNSPGKGIFFNIGSSLWTAYNTASGLLGDTLSYIRLFAIGLTGAILGSVFNTLAFQMTEGIPVYVRWLPVLLILIIGHGINLGLTVIGALVHPIRLIFVEYFNNSQYEGGGKEYQPFRKEVNPSSGI